MYLKELESVLEREVLEHMDRLSMEAMQLIQESYRFTNIFNLLSDLVAKVVSGVVLLPYTILYFTLRSRTYLYLRITKVLKTIGSDT